MRLGIWTKLRLIRSAGILNSIVYWRHDPKNVLYFFERTVSFEWKQINDSQSNIWRKLHDDAKLILFSVLYEKISWSSEVTVSIYLNMWQYWWFGLKWTIIMIQWCVQTKNKMYWSDIEKKGSLRISPIQLVYPVFPYN